MLGSCLTSYVIHKSTLLFDLALLPRQFFDGDALEHAAFCFRHASPNLREQSVGLDHRMRPSVHARVKNWPLQRFQHIRHRYIRWFSREHIPAVRTSKTRNQSTFLHGMKHLFKKPNGDALPPGDGLGLNWA